MNKKRVWIEESNPIWDARVTVDDIDDDLLFSYEPDTTRVDAEIFIHSLTYRETVVVLFKSIGTPVEEIGEVLGLHASNIYKIINDLRRKSINGI